MEQRMVGVFASADSALGAVRLLQGAGYRKQHLTLLGPSPLPRHRLKSYAAQPKIGLKTSIFRTVLWSAAIGAVIVEVLSVMAALLLSNSAGFQFFVAVWAWKFGVFFGGFVGLFLHEVRGLELRLHPAYQEHLDAGLTLLDLQPREGDDPQLRGLLIESGARAILDTTAALVFAYDENTPSPLPERQAPTE